MWCVSILDTIPPDSMEKKGDEIIQNINSAKTIYITKSSVLYRVLYVMSFTFLFFLWKDVIEIEKEVGSSLTLYNFSVVCFFHYRIYRFRG